MRISVMAEVTVYLDIYLNEFGSTAKLYFEKPHVENDCKPIIWKEDLSIPEEHTNVSGLCVMSKNKAPLLASVVGQFTNLVKLDLANNFLQEVPDCLREGLLFLKELDLSYNKIKEFGFIPACHKKLKILKLNDNYLQNIPRWILQCEAPNLIEFLYDFNRIESFEQSLFYLSKDYKLKILHLVNCCLIVKDFECLKSIKTLEELDISNAAMDAKNMNRFPSCDSLFDKPSWLESIRVLKLNNLGISILSEAISFLKNLRVLELRSNSLTWLPEYFCYLENLEVLDLSKNTITSLPLDFGYLINLKVLKMPHNQLNVIIGLDCLQKLKHLDLYNNELDTFEWNCNQFEFLDLELNYLDTEQIESSYEIKRHNLRTEIGEIHRPFGKKLLDDYCQISEQSYVTSEVDSEEEGKCEAVNSASEIEENWEVTKKPDGYISLCSPSDEEWTGFDVCLRKCFVKQIKEIAKFEDYIYVDAD